MKTLKNIKDEVLPAEYLPVLSSHSARQSVIDPPIKRGRLYNEHIGKMKTKPQQPHICLDETKMDVWLYIVSNLK